MSCWILLLRCFAAKILSHGYKRYRHVKWWTMPWPETAPFPRPFDTIQASSKNVMAAHFFYQPTGQQGRRFFVSPIRAMLSILRKTRPSLEGDVFVGSMRVRMPIAEAIRWVGFVRPKTNLRHKALFFWEGGSWMLSKSWKEWYGDLWENNHAALSSLPFGQSTHCVDRQIDW